MSNTSDFLAIYGACLSTALAIPKSIKFIQGISTPLRFIVQNSTVMLAQKNTPSEQKYLFDITIVNKSDQSLYLSKIDLELTRGSRRALLAETPFTKNNFGEELRAGMSTREYCKCSDQSDNLFGKNSAEYFTRFRIIVETSTGRKVKSDYISQEIFLNPKTSIWRKLSQSDFRSEFV